MNRLTRMISTRVEPTTAKTERFLFIECFRL
jgi:hypothetical protein